MDNYQLYCSDVLNQSIIDPDSIDLTITSPPYNLDIQYNSNNDGISYQEYLLFTQKWLANVFYWTKNTGRLALNIPLDKNKGGQKSMGADITTLAKKVGFKYHSTIIWNEGNISRRTAWGSWLSASAPYVIAPVELIVILYKDQWKRQRQGKNDITKKEFMEWTNGLWTFNGESKKRVGHPAPFPLELPKRCIKLFSFIDDTILDPFVGSGTTVIESIKHHRKAIGIDLDSQYIELAKQRINQECFNNERANNSKSTTQRVLSK